MFWYGCLIPGEFLHRAGNRDGRTYLAHAGIHARIAHQDLASGGGQARHGDGRLPGAFGVSRPGGRGLELDLAVARRCQGAPQFAISEASTISATLLGLVAAGLVTSVLFWVTAAAIGQPNELRRRGGRRNALWLDRRQHVRRRKARPLAPRRSQDVVGMPGGRRPGGFLLLLADDAGHPRPSTLPYNCHLCLVAVAAWTLRRFGWLGACDNRSASAAARPRCARRLWLAKLAASDGHRLETVARSGPFMSRGHGVCGWFRGDSHYRDERQPVDWNGQDNLRTMILSTRRCTRP